MKKHDGVKRVFIGFLAAVTVLCMLPVQNVDAAGGGKIKAGNTIFFLMGRRR